MTSLFLQLYSVGLRKLELTLLYFLLHIYMHDVHLGGRAIMQIMTA